VLVSKKNLHYVPAQSKTSAATAARRGKSGRTATMDIKILVGTMTGTAEMVADEMNDALEELGHTVEVTAMDGLEAEVFDGGGTFLIVTSTYGQGDVPDNAMGLYEDLTKNSPDLSDVQYGVFSLGDRTYAETFNFGGKKFDEILSKCGAKRIGEVFTHDASSGSIPEDDGIEWVKEWAGNFKEVRAAA
jgi:MioC protein